MRIQFIGVTGGQVTVLHIQDTRPKDLEGVGRSLSEEVDEERECDDNAGDADGTEAGEIFFVQL